MMILPDGITINDGYCQYKMYDQTAAFLQKLPHRFLNKISKNNFEHIGGSPRKMVYYYSKRFPNMCMSSSFYDDIMSIAEIHFKYYQSRWFDFGQLHDQSSVNDNAIAWSKRPVIQPIITSIPYYNTQKEKPINQTLKLKFPNKLVTILVPNSNSNETLLPPSSPLNFEVSVKTVLSNNNNDYSKFFEENNNNKINIIENEDDTKFGSISSDGSRSDLTDEKMISYAEVIKHPKPPKVKKITKTHVTEEPKKEELIKSNRIPPSKKVSIKLPDAPFLPNNQHCAFCKNNGEEESVYRTHFVKDESGNVKCPFLSIYTCPQCKATGAKAHTISRCPLSNKNRSNKFNKQ
ncbi:uncharacterized protein LOC126900830 [Daktulosphaira vitifoliae]|uniref:uncharacterized protein LOC126900830 n=1 Tax=Daktulosphaira vitifoliae TaxID=58002 RepID=UPI0021A9AB82|nr:uncharacterized protein LOC126900830 [Daktulosphaira vitifoliae]